ncbi:MAG: hypothetical protein Tsb0020_19540 [Haliangiales bacterium]
MTFENNVQCDDENTTTSTEGGDEPVKDPATDPIDGLTPRRPGTTGNEGSGGSGGEN